jgi:hypothetical protein
MANRQVNVYGNAVIQVALDRSTYAELGTTRDGVGITSDGYFIDVKNDENGGDAGPPVEIQFLGETARIRCELTKFEPILATRLEDHCQSAAPGQPADAGTLLFANAANGSTINVGQGGACAVRIVTTNKTRTYGLCVIHDAVELNRSTKFTTFVVTFTAYKDPVTGKLWVE